MKYGSCANCSCRNPNGEGRTSVIVYTFVCLFGIGSWLAINGIWMELPILVEHAPEKWSLPSYLTIITELANVGPLFYFVGRKLKPSMVHERPTVFIIVILGTSACLLLSFLWDRTSYIFGAERSTWLIILAFFVALVDCTSTVTFLPFMALLPGVYMAALFTGENLSSLLPSFFALIQGIDHRTKVSNTICGPNITSCHNVTMTVFTGLNFGPKYFFVFLAMMMLISGGAFLALNYLPHITAHHIMKYSELQEGQRENNDRQSYQRTVSCEEDNQSLLDSNSLLAQEHQKFPSNLSLASFPGNSSEVFLSADFSDSRKHFIYLLVLQAWINCISNGIISQIQAFACEPYGTMAYHLAVTLAGIASAITCFAYTWLPTKSVKVISLCCFLYTALSGYIVLLAAQSPSPLLKGTKTGSALVVLAFLLSGIFVNYAKVAICTIFREIGHDELFWCGVAIQIGSFVGAIIMFPLVNVAKLFSQ